MPAGQTVYAVTGRFGQCRAQFAHTGENHLGPFLLTELLLPLLREAARTSPPGAMRIVNTSSNASEMIDDLPWGDLARFDALEQAGRIYSPGKLANGAGIAALLTA